MCCVHASTSEVVHVHCSVKRESLSGTLVVHADSPSILM